jgi:hypothetical protein
MMDLDNQIRYGHLLLVDNLVRIDGSSSLLVDMLESN